MLIDAIIPAHGKDVDTLEFCVDGIRENVAGINRIIVVSKDRLTDKAEFYSEESFPFSVRDVGDIVGFHRKTFNYFGSLIQNTAPLIIPDLCRDVLVCDADTVFLKPVEFVDGDVGLYNVSYDVPPKIISHPYFEHFEKLIPGLTKQTKYSGICHHMLMQQDILQEIFDRVEGEHGEPFWKADLSVTLQPYASLSPKPPHGEAPLLRTTWELYFNYVFKYHPDRCRIRKQNSILAYKGRTGVDGEVVHNIGSRTNLNGNVQVIDRLEEAKFSFATFQDSFKHIIQRCKHLGYDAVTFQNHTRIGSQQHRKNFEGEISENFNI